MFSVATVYGAGRRRTLLVRSRIFANDWYLKVRPYGEAMTLKVEYSKHVALRGVVPVSPECRGWFRPPVAALVTRAVPGIPGNEAVRRIEWESLIDELAVATSTLLNASAPAALEAANRPTDGRWLTQRASCRRTSLHPDHQDLSVDAFEDVLAAPCPKMIEPAVVHGDLFLPNVMFDHCGKFVAFLDLGDAHLGCRWEDIAILSWALDMVIGPPAASSFLDRVGPVPPEELSHHRLMYDVLLTARDPWAWL